MRVGVTSKRKAAQKLSGLASSRVSTLGQCRHERYNEKVSTIHFHSYKIRRAKKYRYQPILRLQDRGYFGTTIDCTYVFLQINVKHGHTV